MTVEEQLRALNNVFVELPAGLARTSWHRGRRQRRQQWGAGVAVGAVVLGGTAGIATHLATSTATLGPAGRPADASATPTPSMAASAVPTAVDEARAGAEAVASAKASAFYPDLRASNAAKDPGLAAVSLPDPVPNFPVRFGPDPGLIDTGFGNGRMGLATTFGVGVSAPYYYNRNSASPTGPEVSITVARVGLFATSAGTNGKVDGYPVIATTTARGVPAVVVKVDADQTELLLSQGGFAINVAGDSAYSVNGVPVVGPNVPVSQLVALADALQNIPSS